MLQKLLVRVCILLFIIINLFASGVQGQSLLYNNYYTQENGLCSSVINQIVKDKKGFLWLTTESGLMRFDGYKFKTYRHYPSIPASLTSSDIRTIGFTDDSDMILRTENSITKYYRKNNTFKSLYTINENYSTIRFEKGFNKGDWWLFKRDSLIKFNIETETIQSYKLLEDQTSIEVNSVNFSKKRIIYASRNKCFCFNILNNKFEPISLKPLSNKDESIVYSLVFTFNKNQYLFKDGNIYKWNEKDNVFDFVVDTKIQLTSREQILSHYVTSKYILLALSDLKIIKINIENGRANWIQLDESPKSKVQFALNFFKSSNENEVWLNGGLTKTIYKLSIETNEVSKTIIELPAQFNSEDLYRVQYIFPTDKVIWVAVSGFGLIKYELTNYSFASFKPFVKDELDRDIWSNNIRTIADWDDENYVVGSLNGTFLFNKKNKKFNEFPIRFTEDVQHILTNGKILNYGNYTLLGGWYTKWLIVINRLNNEYKIIDLTPENKTDYLSIRSLFIDSKKNLWVGTTNSKLFKLPFDSVMQNKNYHVEQLINKQNGLLAVNSVFAIEEATNNEILLGTQFGFYSYNYQNNKFKLFRNNPDDVNSISWNNVRSICPTKNVIWIGTNGGGLNKYDIINNTFQSFTISNGLPEDYIYAILPDKQNNLWLATNKGIGCFNTKKQTCQNYSLIDGIQNFEFNTNAALQSKDGNYIFGGINGITIFNPTHIYKNTDVPTVAFTKIKINDTEMPESRTSFDCKHFENSISMEFVALSYYQNQENTYSYKLEGFDKDWIYAGNQHQVNYTNLPPGNYIFKVKAANNSGVWNDVGAAINIAIPSIWYTTWWLKAILAIAFVLVIYFIYRYRLNEEIKLQQLRNNIAQDLHDEIGSNLSSISLFTQVAQQTSNSSTNNEQKIALNKIEQYAQISQDAMSDIVWMINPRNDAFNNILSRMQTLASEIFEANNINLKMEIDKQLETKELNMHQRKNFYLIFKEAINNISKHAHCTQVQIKIDFQLGNINTVIMDNGNGFIHNNKEAGNGLINMQKRAKDIGGTLVINSNINKGTTLSLTFPIDKIYKSKKIRL